MRFGKKTCSFWYNWSCESGKSLKTTPDADCQRSKCKAFSWHKAIVDSHRQNDIVLDTFLLNHYVMGKLYSFENVRTCNQIKYVPGSKGFDGILAYVKKKKGSTGFFMHGIGGAAYLDCSERGIMLPPKSTWFEPRIIKGLISQKFL